jgi:hypothetical protein
MAGGKGKGGRSKEQGAGSGERERGRCPVVKTIAGGVLFDPRRLVPLILGSDVRGCAPLRPTLPASLRYYCVPVMPASPEEAVRRLPN